MTRDYDINDLAAEYVLGTLDRAERFDVEARRVREPELAAAIEATEVALAPLFDVAAPVAAPAELRSRLLATIAQTAQVNRPRVSPMAEVADDAARPGSGLGDIRPAANEPGLADFAETPFDPADVVSLTAARNEIVSLRARVSRWRSIAAGLSTLAASFAGVVIYRETLPRVEPPQPQNFVAVLQKDAQSPAFLMTVDVVNRVFTVRPVAAKQPAGKSYELWIIHEKLGTPKSLGVIADNAPRAGVSLAAYEPAAIHGATYAITVEPEGGSPTGAPSSAPVFVGKLIPAGLEAN